MAAEGTPLREVFARFGTVFDTGPLAAGNTAVNLLIGSLRNLGGAIAGSALIGGLAALTDEVREVGTEISRSSRSLGLSTESLQAWRFAAQRAGVGAEQLTPALQSLRRNASAAAHGGAGMAQDFRALGVSLRDSHGTLRSTDELLQGVLEGLARTSDPTERAAIAMRLLGEQGARLGPLFDRGVEGVRAARGELEALGGGLSGETIEAAAELTAETDALDAALLSLRGRIAVFLLPAFTRIAEVLSGAVAAFARFTDHSRLLQAGLAVLGLTAISLAGDMVVAWAAAVGPFLALGAAITLLVLIVDDLWVAIDGGDSVIADLIDSLEEAAITGDGFWGSMALGAEFVIDLLASVVQLIARIAAGAADLAGVIAEAFGGTDIAASLHSAANDLSNFSQRDLGVEAAPEVAAEVRRAREADPSRASFLPDSFERALAERTVRGRESAAVTNTVNIGRIDTSGLSPEEVERHVGRAVTNALTREAENTIDTVGGGL